MRVPFPAFDNPEIPLIAPDRVSVPVETRTVESLVSVIGRVTGLPEESSSVPVSKIIPLEFPRAPLLATFSVAPSNRVVGP